MMEVKPDAVKTDDITFTILDGDILISTRDDEKYFMNCQHKLIDQLFIELIPFNTFDTADKDLYLCNSFNILSDEKNCVSCGDKLSNIDE